MWDLDITIVTGVSPNGQIRPTFFQTYDHRLLMYAQAALYYHECDDRIFQKFASMNSELDTPVYT